METKYAAVAVTNDRPNSHVDVPYPTQRLVTYEFQTKVTDLKRLAYLPVVIHKGKPYCLPGFEKPRRLPPDLTITFYVDEGDRVALYLGSEAKEGYRSRWFYEVPVEDRAVHVLIQEKRGRHPDSDTPQYIRESGTEHYYTAVLTGDIWQQMSHVYTAQEVEQLLSELPKPTREALRRIYDGSLQGPPFRLDVPWTNGQVIHLSWKQDAANNAFQNIHAPVDERKDILPRVHPGCYAALLKAAVDAQIDTLEISSGWRPMLGSVAHRMGFALDVVAISRRGQRSRMFHPITEEEEKAKKAVAAAKENLDRATKANDQAWKKAAEEQLKKAKATYVQVACKLEPDAVRAFRAALARDRRVRQIFDPWYIESNTEDKDPPTLNHLETKLETTHQDHLHITINHPLLGDDESPASVKPAPPSGHSKPSTHGRK